MLTENLGVEMLVTSNEEAHKLISEQYELDKQAGYTRTTAQERSEWAEKVIEGYFAVNEEAPSESVLERLGTYILKEDYEDKRKNKSKLVEYNFHSDNQTRRRRTGVHARRFRKDGTFIDRGEVTIEGWENSIDTDGRVIEDTGRRELTVYEILHKEGYKFSPEDNFSGRIGRVAERTDIERSYN